jgi:hypothetical protein
LAYPARLRIGAAFPDFTRQPASLSSDSRGHSARLIWCHVKLLAERQFQTLRKRRVELISHTEPPANNDTGGILGRRTIRSPPTHLRASIGLAVDVDQRHNAIRLMGSNRGGATSETDIR